MFKKKTRGGSDFQTHHRSAILAVSLATYEVWAAPKLFDGDHGNEARLLDMPPKDLQKRVEGGRSFVLLQAPGRSGKRRAYRADRAGITLVPDTKRFYPEGESAAHVVGFTNNEDRGQEGMELAAGVSDRRSGTA